MTPLDWFKKEKPLLGLLGTGGGSVGGASAPITVKYILVGGGGAGGAGQGGGGGGAGAVRYATIEIATGKAHTYQTGEGGQGRWPAVFPSGPLYGQGGNGTNSFFTDPTVNAGGGGGGGWQQAGPPGSADHGVDGNPFGGGAGGGGQTGPWNEASTGGSGGSVHPEVNNPQGSSYSGGYGYGGPGGGAGNRGGGGGGSGENGSPASHAGPALGGPTQNPSPGEGGNGGIGTQVPDAYIPINGRESMIPASTANGADQLYVYNPGTNYDMPAPENFFGGKVPTTPGANLRYFGSGGGGGAELTRGGYGAGSGGWTGTANYGGGGPGAGAGTNDPAVGPGNGSPGINGRGGGGGGGGPNGEIAPGRNPAYPTGAWPMAGHPGGSGILIVQYPNAYTLTRSQPTYTSAITGAGPEGVNYFVALGPAGSDRGYNWPHPGTGTVQWDLT